MLLRVKTAVDQRENLSSSSSILSWFSIFLSYSSNFCSVGKWLCKTWTVSSRKGENLSSAAVATAPMEPIIISIK